MMDHRKSSDNLVQELLRVIYKKKRVIYLAVVCPNKMVTVRTRFPLTCSNNSAWNMRHVSFLHSGHID